MIKKYDYLHLILTICLILLPLWESLSQNVEISYFTPPVIRWDRAKPVLFEAMISGAVTDVKFEYAGADRPMYDDGTNGDKLSGDNIYTISFPASDITGLLTDEDVFRPFVGFCKLYNGDDIRFRLNVLAEVWTPDIPLVSAKKIDSECQASSHIVNILEDGLSTVTANDAKRWANLFYKRFEDDYDFLNIILHNGYRGNRFHMNINNNIHGLGLPLFNNAASHGSGGRLMGITLFPLSIFFDGATTSYQHEMGHQWINFLHNTPFETGIPHWPISDVTSGVMGYSSIAGVGLKFPFDLVPEGNDYRLTHRPGESVFNDLELYLMGLLPADSVQAHFVFDDQDQPVINGGILYGPVTWVTIDDIIDSVGVRKPDYLTSQKTFRLATMIVSEELLSVEAMSFYNYFSKRAELHETVQYKMGLSPGKAIPFYLSTGGRGELDTHIEGFPVSVDGDFYLCPKNFTLYQNYPNPFNPETTIRFHVKEPGRVVLKIFDILGNEVAVLEDTYYQAGEYRVRFRGEGLASGIYFYGIEMEGFRAVRKMVVLE
jgi:hypothetical protein